MEPTSLNLLAATRFALIVLHFCGLVPEEEAMRTKKAGIH
jgi:hypothetical protein